MKTRQGRMELSNFAKQGRNVRTSTHTYIYMYTYEDEAAVSWGWAHPPPRYQLRADDRIAHQVA